MNNRFLTYFIFLILYNLTPKASGQSEWCQLALPPCENCDITVTADDTKVSAEDQKICFQGNFTFTGIIEVTNAEICIGEGVTIDVVDLEGLEGSYTIYNYGTIITSKEYTIKNLQSFYNFGTFKINTKEQIDNQNEMIIEDGGFYCNSGYTFVSGDVLNHGILKSSGLFEIADEFKNSTTGVAYITEMIVQDEISNSGTIYLQGYIESLDKSFKNFAGSKVIGLDHPCNAIKALVNIENNGTIDGSGGPIAIWVDETNYIGAGDLIPNYFYKNSENLSQDCFRLLPVQWAGLTIQYSATGRSVMINWSTTKEWENSHFELQKSLNGIADFVKIGEVKGMGWKDTVTEYAFEDKEVPLAGGNIFYRIKQVDFNGNYTYSKVLSVQANGLEFTKGVWRAYPNPTTGDAFNLDVLNSNEYQGEAVQVKLVSPSAGGKLFNGSDITQISSNLSNALKQSPNGIYVLEIAWGQKIEYIKIIKR